MATLQQRLTSFINTVGVDYKTLQTTKAMKNPSLIDRIQYGTDGKSKRTTIAHRNGRSCYPEGSMEGLIACADSGFMLEVDVRWLSDGTLVGCHDATVDRTMSNIAPGNVSSKSVWAWKDARVNPTVKGGRSGTPLFFEDVLDRFGGKNLLMAELKDAAAITPFIASIKNRGLEADVICQSFTYSVCLQFVAAGLQALYLTSTAVPPEGWAAVKAAGINYVGPSWSVAASLVSGAKAAGLRVVGYTVTTKTESDAAYAKGFDMLFSDDPWITSNQYFVQNAIPRVEYGWPGWRPIQPSGSTFTEAATDLPQAIGTGVGLFGANAGSVYRTLPCDWCIPLNRPYKINMDLHFGPNGSSQSGGLRFAVHKNTVDSNLPWLDAAYSGQNGFQFAVRRNGQAQVWQYVNGAAASSVGSTTAQTGALQVAPVGQEGFCKLSIVVDATNISMYLSDCPFPTSVTVANTLAMTDAKLTLFWSLSDGSFENIQVIAM